MAPDLLVLMDLPQRYPRLAHAWTNNPFSDSPLLLPRSPKIAVCRHGGQCLLAHAEEPAPLTFSLDEVKGICHLFLTQSNVIAAVDEGRERLDDLQEWLVLEVTRLFPGPRAAFRFRSAITYLQKR
jgi:hypothetical protein